LHTNSHPESGDHTELIVQAVDDLTRRDDGNNVRASWNYSADNIRANTAHFEPAETETMIALFRWCTDPRHPMRQEEAARRIGFSSQMIYQLMTGKYRNQDRTLKRPSAEFIQKVHEFLALEAKRFALGKTEFVMIPTAKKICTACDLARESQTIVFIYGPSHIGKTWAVERHYTPNNNHGRTIYCRMKAASGLGGMVRAMCVAAGISPNGNTADLIQRLKNASSSNTLWIIDEVHLLANTYRKGSFFACMEVLREIFDETECGMVLIFTILEDVKAARQKELQQLWRRGVHKVPLPLMPTKADLAAILKHHGLEFPDRKFSVTIGNITEEPYEVLRQQAKENGLKAITERLRYAKKLSEKYGSRAVTWNHVIEAHLIIEKQAVQEGEWV
jgi:DNA transposition AAA+ family ATPase